MTAPRTISAAAVLFLVGCGTAGELPQPSRRSPVHPGAPEAAWVYRNTIEPAAEEPAPPPPSREEGAGETMPTMPGHGR